jgi:hypothetical protein
MFLMFGACVAQSVKCLTTDWTNGVRNPAEANYFSSSLCVQSSSEAQLASCPMGPFPGGKARPGRDSDHPTQSIAKVKKEW